LVVKRKEKKNGLEILKLHVIVPTASAAHLLSPKGAVHLEL
jgi:hypothetical protein